MIAEIILAAGLAASPPPQPEPQAAVAELWHSLWTQAFCAGWQTARQQQIGKFDLMRKQMGPAWSKELEDALAIPGPCPRKE